MRELLTNAMARASEERPLLLLLLFHVAGVYWLAGARASWTKIPGILSLLAAIPCWVWASRLSPSLLGLSALLAGVVGGLFVLAGLWLFLAGGGPREWLWGAATAMLG